MVTHRGTTVIAEEVIFLVVSTAEELKGTRVGVVTHGLQNHVVTLLDSQVADILHSLHERQCSSVSLFGFFLQMHGES